MSFGQNINNTVGQIEYMSLINDIVVDLLPIVFGIFGGLLLLCLILVSAICAFVFYHRSTVSKYKVKLEYAQQPVYT